MATSGEKRSLFSNTNNGSRPAFYLRLAYTRTDVDEPGNRSRWSVSLRVDNDSRWSASWTASRPNYAITRNGSQVAGGAVPEGTFDFRDGAAYHNIAIVDLGWISHSSTGLASFTLSGDVANVQTFGDAPAIDISVSQDHHRLPTAPGTPSISSRTSTSISATWGAANGQGSDILEYQALLLTTRDNTSTAVSQPSTGTSRSHTFTGLTRNKAYYVYARARTAAGWGPWSENRDTATLSGIPGQVARPTASSVGQNGWTTNWSAASTNGESITGYDINIASNSSFSGGGTNSLAASERSYATTGKSPATTYYVRVRAKTAAGVGAWSPTLSVTTVGSVPGVPGSFSAAAQGVGQARVYFASVSATPAVTKYQIQRADNSSFSSGATVVDEPTSAGTYVVSAPTAGKTYYFRVRAVNSLGAGAWSSVKSITTNDVPAAPKAPTVTASADGKSATISWTAPSSDLPITGYEIVRFHSNNSTVQARYNDNASPLTVSGLTPDTTYIWAVRAISAVGDGILSARTTRKQNGTPSAPSFTSLVVVDGDTATVSFSAPSSNGGSAVTQYRVEYSTSSSFSSYSVYTTSSTGTKTINGLTAGTRYYWRIRAVNAVGIGDASTVRNALQDQPPGAPRNLTATPAATGTSITLTWDAPTSNGGTPPNQYTVVRYSSTGVQQTTYTTSQRTFTVTGLKAGTQYRWAVRATNNAGTGPLTAQVSRTQPSPSVQAGDYFDGSTDGTGTDASYSWAGTANASQSIATQPSPLGWTNFAFGAADSGGTGVVAQTSDLSIWGDYSVSATFWSPASDAGFLVGVGDTSARRAAVPEEADVRASMFVWTPKDQIMQIVIRFYNSSGNLIGGEAGPLVAVPEGYWTRVQGAFYSPTGTTTAFVGLRDAEGTIDNITWTPWEAGDVIYYEGAMLTLGSSPFPYFDGSFGDTETYTYSWEGTADQSASRRDTIPQDEAQVDPLQDPDCPPFPQPPRPPSIDISCAEPVDQWRRYWVEIPASAVTVSSITLPILTLRTTNVAASQVRIRFWEDPYGEGEEGLDVEDYISEQIISYIPKNTELVLDSMSKRAYATVGEHESIPADHLVFGQDGNPPIWPTMDCGIGYMIALDVPSFLPVGSVSMEVQMARRIR